MPPSTIKTLTQQVELGQALQAGRDSMHEPQDLPGRFGRVVAAVDRVLAATTCPAVLVGGWAVWRHGYAGRVTQDVDIVLPRERVDEFLRVAAVSGFDVLRVSPGRWPKVLHRETQITVDILPEGERPGTSSRPAPTTIPHPQEIGGSPGRLSYVELPGLVELKLAAGRARDLADVVELLRANAGVFEEIRSHVAALDATYESTLQELAQEAGEPHDR